VSPVLLLNVPMGHSVGVSEPAGQNEPFGHKVCVATVAPLVQFLYFVVSAVLQYKAVELKSLAATI
jgi:hypothetical protein